LNQVHTMAEEPTGSVRQLTAFEETNSLPEVVRRMLDLSEREV